jgi:ketosteroid isomerase-like protein
MKKSFILYAVAFTFSLFISGNSQNYMQEKSNIDSQTQSTLETIEKFNEAFNRHDVDAIMNLMTEDCIFENTRPVPDGERIVGQENVRKFWDNFFSRSPKANFEAEEIFAAGDRCVVRWVYKWVKDGKEGHVRGVDIFRVHNGKVAEKLSYVKG